MHHASKNRNFKEIPDSLKRCSNTVPFDLRKWDPEHQLQSQSSKRCVPLKSRLHVSPVARFILESFRKSGNWGPEVLAELNKLRRVTPNLVSEVLKVENNAFFASKFFHWAGRQKGYKHDFRTYNAFAYCLNRNRMFQAADQLPELMKSQGRMPSEKQFEILIRMHCDSGRGLRIHYIYEKMKKFGVTPRIFLYNRILDGLVKTDHIDLALSVYDDFQRHGLEEENMTFMILLKGLCKEGKIESVLEILHRMRGKMCKPDVFAYTAMVKILVERDYLNECLQIWEEMKRDGVDPDVVAYATLIKGLCKKGRVSHGHELLKEMKKMGFLIDREIYKVLITSFVNAGKTDVAFDLLKELVGSGCRADLAIYNSIIYGLCETKRVDKALKIFDLVVREELEPDMGTFNPLLSSYAELKRMDDFIKILLRMEKYGFSIIDNLPIFFSYLISKGDNISLALEVFQSLKSNGYSSVPVYNLLMEELIKIGDIKRALSLLSEMKVLNIELDTSSYDIGVITHAENGNLQEACSYYKNIIDMSGIPSVAAYSTLTKALCRAGEIDASMCMIRDCLASVTSGPMEFKYSLSIIHACRYGKIEKVIELLKEMVEEGCWPTEVTCSAIIHGFCRRGTMEQARQVFLHMKETKLVNESKMIEYNEMLMDHMKKQTSQLLSSGLKILGLETSK